MSALGDYVRARRDSLADSTIGRLCAAVDLSHTTWTNVEKGRGPHSKVTLRKVAQALGESPATLYDMAGIDYDPVEDVEPDDGDALGSKLQRIEAMLADQAEWARRIEAILTQADSAAPDRTRGT